MGHGVSLFLWHSLCWKLNGERLQVTQAGSQELVTVEKRLTFFTTGLGRDKSMTVSLEEMLEEEDMLSRWLLGLNMLQSCSPMVASVQTAGTGDWACTATWTTASLLVLLTGLLEGKWLRHSCLITAAAGSSLGSLKGCIWISVCSSSVSAPLLLWAPWPSCNVRDFSNRSLREGGEVLERPRAFSASPLSVIEQSRASVDGTLDWNSAFIAVDDDKGRWERCCSSGSETVPVTWLFEMSSKFSANGGAGFCSAK